MCSLGDFLWLTRPILALSCRLQVEQVNVMESAGGPLVMALRSLRFFQLHRLSFFTESCSFVDETTLVAPVQSVPKTQLVCRNPSERL